MMRFLKPVFLTILLSVVGVMFARNLAQLDWKAQSLDAKWFIFGVCALFAHLLCLVACWKSIGAVLGFKQSYGFALMGWGFPLYGKYLPGRIARYAAVLAVYKKRGATVETIAAMLGLELVASLSGFLLLTMVFSALGLHPLARDFRFAAWGAIALGLVAIHPRIVNFGIGVLNRILKREFVGIQTSYLAMLSLVCAYALSYVFLCASNDFFFRSAGANIGFADSSALFGFAGLAGMFAIFSPSGLGAREAVLQLGLQGFVSAPQASLLTLLSRAGMTLAELAFVVFPLSSYLLARRKERRILDTRREAP
jgi:glycosyltransferase 2 family protein